MNTIAIDLPNLPPKEVVDTHLPTGVRIYGYTAEQMRNYARAAIGAQPYPGGQDALPPIRDDQPLRGDEPIGEQHDARMFNRGWNACREAAAALSARQPVGQEPVGDAGRSAAYDAIDRFLRNNMDDEAYAAYVEHLEELWAAVPAQAVDLGPKNPKLIGWRMADYTAETADPAQAQNWAANVSVLPIFEGDPNTKLGNGGANAHG